jgi:hypothetical protein
MAMAQEVNATSKQVGPIVSSGPWLSRVLAALNESNERLHVINRGSYVRVFSDECCVLTRDAFTKHLAADFDWHAFLNLVMPSFAGKLQIEEEKIEWRAQ